MIIILGDVGFNYFLDERDEKLKKKISEKYKCTFFCIHGNHECRPTNIKTYQKKIFCGGIVYYEPQFPNLLFAKDGEVYTFDTQEGELKCLVCGGAYSVDKDYRIKNGYGWFPDEQPSLKIKNYIEKIILQNEDIDIVFTHTCPHKYIPTEAFLPNIDQSKVDNSTESWLNIIEKQLNYKKWYCGHWHINKTIDKVKFLYTDIEDLTTIMF